MENDGWVRERQVLGGKKETDSYGAFAANRLPGAAIATFLSQGKDLVNIVSKSRGKAKETDFFLAGT